MTMTSQVFYPDNQKFGQMPSAKIASPLELAADRRVAGKSRAS
jgi:hypothetical protein